MGLLNLFNCRHPALNLAVKRNHTESVVDDDFTRVTYHLVCIKCGKPINLTYSKLNHGVDGFLSGVK